MKSKAFFSLIALFVIVVFSSFSASKSNYQIECVRISPDGYVLLKIWDLQKGANYKLEQAQIDVVSNLLYAGFSGKNDCISQTPFLNSNEEIANFKKVEKNFFSKSGKYAFFIKGSIKVSMQNNLTPNKSIKVFEIEVSKNELRKYLEEQKIIKSLNNGF